ncbi:hypothetical protein [Marinobacter sp. V034]|uniref:hypothetical protein n=1 Tax=Marinobacter sp. V034 TaxID=3459610 RepID=UPI004044D011
MTAGTHNNAILPLIEHHARNGNTKKTLNIQETKMRVIHFDWASKLMVAVMLVCLSTLGMAQENAAKGPSEKEMKQFAQQQFEAMYKRAMESASEQLEAGEAIKPFAVVADRGNKVRLIRIGEIEQMKAYVALEVMRRSLKAMVKKGNIGATCLVYIADNPNPQAEAKQVIVAEMEHIFGFTLAELTPFAVEGGKTVYGKPVVVESKPVIFKINEEAAE